MRILTRTVMIVGISATAVSWLLPRSTTADPQQAAQEKVAVSPIDKTAWAKKLADLNNANWLKASGVGNELAEMPPDEGYEILQENWKKIEQIEARLQILKSWKFAQPLPLHARNHPRLVDVLDLGMRDRSPDVRAWTLDSLQGIAFQDFADDFPAYLTWYTAARGKPVVDVICDSVGRFVLELAKAEAKQAEKGADLVLRETTFRDIPAARQAALDAGILQVIERWIACSLAPKADRSSLDLASRGLKMLAALQVGEDDLRRITVPLLAVSVPAKMRTAAVRAIGRKEFPWALDLVSKALADSVTEGERKIGPDIWGIARTLADFEDPKVIPAMIAVIDADNTHDTVYGVGYFGLGRLTGVKYDAAHDGPWWRNWWNKNREKYPAGVREMEIPQLTKKTGAHVTESKKDE